MGGSLWKIWPWKLTLETYTDRHGVVKPLVQENILPVLNQETIIAVALAVFGFAFILIMTKLANTSQEVEAETE